MALPLLVNPGGWPIKHLAYAAARLVNAPRGAGAKRRPRYPDANWPPPCPRTTADRSILAMVRLGLSRGGGGIPSRRRQQRPGDARFCISSLWSNSAGAKEKKTQWRGHHKSPPPKRQSKEPSAKVGNMQGAGNPVTFCFMAVDEKLHRRHAGRAKGPLHVGFLFFLFWNCGN